MSKNHYTPEDVAKVLAKHAPHDIERLLEPSVGEGLLLGQFVTKINSDTHITCIDIDSRALSVTKSMLAKSNAKSVSAINGDFLAWSTKKLNSKNINHFDCVVMNPPFLGRRNDWVTIENTEHMNAKKCPIEIAFLINAIKLLKNKGTLLAIVPASVVSSDSTVWFRSFLLEQGRIDYIHELPKFTFKGVETRVYLLVFIKGLKNKKIKLRNHELMTPKNIEVNADVFYENKIRFDFGFYEHSNNYNRVMTAWDNLEWVTLDNLCKINRGSTSIAENSKLFHTSKYSNGFWGGSTKFNSYKRSHVDKIEDKDILVKRVGRGCAKSFGWLLNGVGAKISDCVLRISPLNKKNSIDILFWLRVLASGDDYYRKIERGTGATYISKKELLNFQIPTKLNTTLRKNREKYASAVRKRDYQKMCEIESDTRKYLCKKSVLNIELK